MLLVDEDAGAREDDRVRGGVARREEDRAENAAATKCRPPPPPLVGAAMNANDSIVAAQDA